MVDVDEAALGRAAPTRCAPGETRSTPRVAPRFGHGENDGTCRPTSSACRSCRRCRPRAATSRTPGRRVPERSAATGTRSSRRLRRRRSRASTPARPRRRAGRASDPAAEFVPYERLITRMLKPGSWACWMTQSIAAITCDTSTAPSAHRPSATRGVRPEPSRGTTGRCAAIRPAMKVPWPYASRYRMVGFCESSERSGPLTTLPAEVEAGDRSDAAVDQRDVDTLAGVARVPPRLRAGARASCSPSSTDRCRANSRSRPTRHRRTVCRAPKRSVPSSPCAQVRPSACRNNPFPSLPRRSAGSLWKATAMRASRGRGIHPCPAKIPRTSERARLGANSRPPLSGEATAPITPMTRKAAAPPLRTHDPGSPDERHYPATPLRGASPRLAVHRRDRDGERRSSGRSTSARSSTPGSCRDCRSRGGSSHPPSTSPRSSRSTCTSASRRTRSRCRRSGSRSVSSSRRRRTCSSRMSSAQPLRSSSTGGSARSSWRSTSRSSRCARVSGSTSSARSRPQAMSVRASGP